MFNLFRGDASTNLKRCTLDNKLYPTTEFYKGQPYNKNNDDFRRLVARSTNGALGTKQVRELLTQLRKNRK